MGDQHRPPFQVGIGLGTTDPDTLRRCARLGDEGGIAFVSVGDNPGHLMETYVSLTVLATTTQRCRVGTSMTNPVSRDPLVVASALSTLDRLAPGRVFLGISTGRARAPAPLADLRDHLVALRELWTEGKTVLRGREHHLSWDASPVPVVVGASGPRALRLAGELADGVIIETGVTPEAMDKALTSLDEGARSAGRSVDDLEQWWYLKSALADTTGEALDHGVAGLAASAALVLGRDPAGKGVPARFHDACRRARAAYDMSSHVSTSGPDPNRALVSDPAFRDYLIDRYGCIGSPADWKDRIEQLRRRGVERIFCAAVVPDRERFISTAAGVLASVAEEDDRGHA